MKTTVRSSRKFSNFSRQWMTIRLALTDLLSLSLAASLAIAIRMVLGDLQLALARYINLWPLLFAFIAVYAIANLYPTVGLNPIEELRRLSLITTITFFMLIVFSFWGRVAGSYSRLALSLFWILSLVMVPLFRWLSRRIAVHANNWGEPVAWSSTDLTRRMTPSRISLPLIQTICYRTPSYSVIFTFAPPSLSLPRPPRISSP